MRKNGAICSGFTQILKGGRGSGIQGKISHSSSGWGDGYYPVYFGYDAKGKVCAVYVRFIDIEASYKEQE